MPTVFDTEGLLKVTGSHVHGKCGEFLDTVQDEDAVTTDF